MCTMPAEKELLFVEPPVPANAMPPATVTPVLTSCLPVESCSSGAVTRTPVIEAALIMSSTSMTDATIEAPATPTPSSLLVAYEGSAEWPRDARTLAEVQREPASVVLPGKSPARAAAGRDKHTEGTKLSASALLAIEAASVEQALAAAPAEATAATQATHATTRAAPAGDATAAQATYATTRATPVGDATAATPAGEATTATAADVTAAAARTRDVTAREPAGEVTPEAPAGDATAEVLAGDATAAAAAGDAIAAKRVSDARSGINGDPSDAAVSARYAVVEAATATHASSPAVAEAVFPSDSCVPEAIDCDSFAVRTSSATPPCGAAAVPKVSPAACTGEAPECSVVAKAAEPSKAAPISQPVSSAAAFFDSPISSSAEEVAVGAFSFVTSSFQISCTATRNALLQERQPVDEEEEIGVHKDEVGCRQAEREAKEQHVELSEATEKSSEATSALSPHVLAAPSSDVAFALTSHLAVHQVIFDNTCGSASPTMAPSCAIAATSVNKTAPPASLTSSFPVVVGREGVFAAAGHPLVAGLSLAAAPPTVAARTAAASPRAAAPPIAAAPPAAPPTAATPSTAVATPTVAGPTAAAPAAAAPAVDVPFPASHRACASVAAGVASVVKGDFEGSDFPACLMASGPVLPLSVSCSAAADSSSAASAVCTSVSGDAIARDIATGASAAPSAAIAAAEESLHAGKINSQRHRGDAFTAERAESVPVLHSSVGVSIAAKGQRQAGAGTSLEEAVSDVTAVSGGKGREEVEAARELEEAASVSTSMARATLRTTAARTAITVAAAARGGGNSAAGTAAKTAAPLGAANHTTAGTQATAATTGDAKAAAVGDWQAAATARGDPAVAAITATAPSGPTMATRQAVAATLTAAADSVGKGDRAAAEDQLAFLFSSTKSVATRAVAAAAWEEEAAAGILATEATKRVTSAAIFTLAAPSTGLPRLPQEEWPSPVAASGRGIQSVYAPETTWKQRQPLQTTGKTRRDKESHSVAAATTFASHQKEAGAAPAAGAAAPAAEAAAPAAGGVPHAKHALSGDSFSFPSCLFSKKARLCCRWGRSSSSGSNSRSSSNSSSTTSGNNNNSSSSGPHGGVDRECRAGAAVARTARILCGVGEGCSCFRRDKVYDVRRSRAATVEAGREKHECFLHLRNPSLFRRVLHPPLQQLWNPLEENKEQQQQSRLQSHHVPPRQQLQQQNSFFKEEHDEQQVNCRLQQQQQFGVFWLEEQEQPQDTLFQQQLEKKQQLSFLLSAGRSWQQQSEEGEYPQSEVDTEREIPLRWFSTAAAAQQPAPDFLFTASADADRCSSVVEEEPAGSRKRKHFTGRSGSNSKAELNSFSGDGNVLSERTEASLETSASRWVMRKSPSACTRGVYASSSSSSPSSASSASYSSSLAEKREETNESVNLGQYISSKLLKAKGLLFSLLRNRQSLPAAASDAEGFAAGAAPRALQHRAANAASGVEYEEKRDAEEEEDGDEHLLLLMLRLHVVDEVLAAEYVETATAAKVVERLGKEVQAVKAYARERRAKKAMSMPPRSTYYAAAAQKAAANRRGAAVAAREAEAAAQRVAAAQRAAAAPAAEASAGEAAAVHETPAAQDAAAAAAVSEGAAAGEEAVVVGATGFPVAAAGSAGVITARHAAAGGDEATAEEDAEASDAGAADTESVTEAAAGAARVENAAAEISAAGERTAGDGEGTAESLSSTAAPAQTAAAAQAAAAAQTAAAAQPAAAAQTAAAAAQTTATVSCAGEAGAEHRVEGEKKSVTYMQQQERKEEQQHQDEECMALLQQQKRLQPEQQQKEKTREYQEDGLEEEQAAEQEEGQQKQQWQEAELHLHSPGAYLPNRSMNSSSKREEAAERRREMRRRYLLLLKAGALDDVSETESFGLQELQEILLTVLPLSTTKEVNRLLLCQLLHTSAGEKVAARDVRLPILLPAFLRWPGCFSLLHALYMRVECAVSQNISAELQVKLFTADERAQETNAAVLRAAWHVVQHVLHVEGGFCPLLLLQQQEQQQQQREQQQQQQEITVSTSRSSRSYSSKLSPRWRTTTHRFPRTGRCWRCCWCSRARTLHPQHCIQLNDRHSAAAGASAVDASSPPQLIAAATHSDILDTITRASSNSSCMHNSSSEKCRVCDRCKRQWIPNRSFSQETGSGSSNNANHMSSSNSLIIRGSNSDKTHCDRSSSSHSLRRSISYSGSLIELAACHRVPPAVARQEKTHAMSLLGCHGHTMQPSSVELHQTEVQHRVNRSHSAATAATHITYRTKERDKLFGAATSSTAQSVIPSPACTKLLSGAAAVFSSSADTEQRADAVAVAAAASTSSEITAAAVRTATDREGLASAAAVEEIGVKSSTTAALRQTHATAVADGHPVASASAAQGAPAENLEILAKRGWAAASKAFESPTGDAATTTAVERSKDCYGGDIKTRDFVVTSYSNCSSSHTGSYAPCSDDLLLTVCSSADLDVLLCEGERRVAAAWGLIAATAADNKRASAADEEEAFVSAAAKHIAALVQELKDRGMMSNCLPRHASFL